MILEVFSSLNDSTQHCLLRAIKQRRSSQGSRAGCHGRGAGTDEAGGVGWPAALCSPPEQKEPQSGILPHPQREAQCAHTSSTAFTTLEIIFAYSFLVQNDYKIVTCWILTS